MSRHAFMNAERVVVQVIVGELDESQRAQFLRDYFALFGATEIVAVESGVVASIGDSYNSDSGIFTPPPTPEPEPIVVETPIALVEEILPE